MAPEVVQVDEVYEFCAPKFFDFSRSETPDEINAAEQWFQSNLSYAPSPFVERVKVSRAVEVGSLCDFGTEMEEEKEPEPAVASNPGEISEMPSAMGIISGEDREVQEEKNFTEIVPDRRPCEHQNELVQEEKSGMVDISNSPSRIEKKLSSFAFPVTSAAVIECETPKLETLPVKEEAVKKQAVVEGHTPKPQRISVKALPPTSSKNQTAKKVDTTNHLSAAKHLSGLKPKNRTPSLQSRGGAGLKVETRCPGSITAKKNNMLTDIAQENQAIKRQKLDDGKARQILNVKSRALLHKSKPELMNGYGDIVGSSAAKSCSTAMAGKEAVPPFVSAAELVKKFESRTREMQFRSNGSLSHDDMASIIKRRPKLTLTRPKDPELQTAHRVRAVRVKSTAELEEEMLAKMPKFKARPVNKKILEAPSLPALPKSVPHLPEFKEFHLKTMERASQHTDHLTTNLSTVAASSQHNEGKPLKLTEPRPPHLETTFRARPPKVKSSEELEQEEIEKLPKFKARPLNKKIFESRGDLGLSCNEKRQGTIPQEFHFATDQRLGAPATVVDLFDKLSLQSYSSHNDKLEIPRITTPNPFQLHTEERGTWKERQFTEQIAQKQLEEEKARIPKANPYPYATDYPVVPPKPAPKPCTKPEGFQLESLIRHEEELQRKMEEKKRMEEEDALRRLFKAQPIMKEDPVPLPEKERKPLTEVQEFALHVDDRAVHRAEFDKKIKEKETVYKRLREEHEWEMKMEEEKVVKQMRRTMVPHARPIPKFDHPFQPQKSKKGTTKAKSPALRVNQRAERCHASQMR